VPTIVVYALEFRKNAQNKNIFISRNPSKMKTIYYFYIGMGVIALLFITVYFINNQLGKTVSKFKYPYFLSIKPITISADQSVEILVTSTNQVPKNENIKVFVFNPIGVNTTYDFTSINYYQKFMFPKELKGNGLLQTGNYSVILTSGNKTISAASFNVVYNAFLASFGNFAFTSGLPLTIGLIISIVSTGFQFASSREAEDRREHIFTLIYTNSSHNFCTYLS